MIRAVRGIGFVEVDVAIGGYVTLAARRSAGELARRVEFRGDPGRRAAARALEALRILAVGAASGTGTLHVHGGQLSIETPSADARRNLLAQLEFADRSGILKWSGAVRAKDLHDALSDAIATIAANPTEETA